MTTTEKKIKNPMTNRFETVYDTDGFCKITATNKGIECVSVNIESDHDLDRFAKLVSLAWQEHNVLEAQVRKSLLV